MNDGCLTANDVLLRKMMYDLRSNDVFAMANISEGLRPYPLEFKPQSGFRHFCRRQNHHFCETKTSFSPLANTSFFRRKIHHYNNLAQLNYCLSTATASAAKSPILSPRMAGAILQTDAEMPIASCSIAFFIEFASKSELLS